MKQEYKGLRIAVCLVVVFIILLSIVYYVKLHNYNVGDSDNKLSSPTETINLQNNPEKLIDPLDNIRDLYKKFSVENNIVSIVILPLVTITYLVCKKRNI